MTQVLMSTKDHGLEPDVSGKVRDIFDLGDKLLIVATDRVSAYDVVLPEPLPGKGILLTQITLGWYRFFADDIRTHFITADVTKYPAPYANRQELAGRSMLVHKANRFDVECVVRGYLAGSGWKEYRTSQAVCGVPLPAELVESSRLDHPIFTPATKAEHGHDENISFEEMTRIVPRDTAEKLRDMSIDIYTRAHDYARERGIIVADTKFEFGELGGEIIIIDEMLSPDSSRFWPLAAYEPGRGQHSFDKQFVRDHLDEVHWDHNPPAPSLPPDIIERTLARYREAVTRLFPDIDLGRLL